MLLLLPPLLLPGPSPPILWPPLPSTTPLPTPPLPSLLPPLPLLEPTPPPPPLPPLPSAATAPPPPLVPSTLPRGRLRPSLRLKLRPILTTDTATLELATLASGATEVTALDTAVATPLLDTLVLATAVATTDMDTATAVATDTLVRFTEPKEKRNSRRSANP